MGHITIQRLGGENANDIFSFDDSAFSGVTYVEDSSGDFGDFLSGDYGIGIWDYYPDQGILDIEFSATSDSPDTSDMQEILQALRYDNNVDTGLINLEVIFEDDVGTGNSFTIPVNLQDSAAPVISASQQLLFVEGGTGGETEPKVAFTERTGLTSFVFDLAVDAPATDDGLFTIDNSGQISTTALADARVFDAVDASKNTFTYNVIATDTSGNVSASQAITLTMIDNTVPTLNGSFSEQNYTLGTNSDILLLPTENGVTLNDDRDQLAGGLGNYDETTLLLYRGDTGIANDVFSFNTSILDELNLERPESPSNEVGIIQDQTTNEQIASFNYGSPSSGTGLLTILFTGDDETGRIPTSEEVNEIINAIEFRTTANVISKGFNLEFDDDTNSLDSDLLTDLIAVNFEIPDMSNLGSLDIKPFAFAGITVDDSFSNDGSWNGRTCKLENPAHNPATDEFIFDDSVLDASLVFSFDTTPENPSNDLTAATVWTSDLSQIVAIFNFAGTNSTENYIEA